MNQMNAGISTVDPTQHTYLGRAVSAGGQYGGPTITHGPVTCSGCGWTHTLAHGMMAICGGCGTLVAHQTTPSPQAAKDVASIFVTTGAYNLYNGSSSSETWNTDMAEAPRDGTTIKIKTKDNEVYQAYWAKSTNRWRVSAPLLSFTPEFVVAWSVLTDLPDAK